MKESKVARKAQGPLTALQVKNAKPGKHPDGNGLTLVVTPSGNRKWMLRYRYEGKQRDMGLHRSEEGRRIMALERKDELSLANARNVAMFYRAQVYSGIDPIQDAKARAAEKRKAAESEPIVGMTFREASREYLRRREKDGTAERTITQIRRYLLTHADPFIGDKLLTDIRPSDILPILEERWHTAHETARRMRIAIEGVFKSFAMDVDTVDYRNPAAMTDAMKNRLGKSRASREAKHHASLPGEELPRLMAILMGKKSITAKALTFAIMTAARTGEILGADWEEIDLARKTWTIPGERMKARKEHKIPLNTTALSILEGLEGSRAGLVFGSPQSGPLSNMAMARLAGSIEEEEGFTHFTVHGFRSTFRDWASEETSFPQDLAEMALAHALPNKTEAAYRRGTMFEKRRELMADWEEFAQSVSDRPCI